MQNEAFQALLAKLGPQGPTLANNSKIVSALLTTTPPRVRALARASASVVHPCADVHVLAPAASLPCPAASAIKNGAVVTTLFNVHCTLISPCVSHIIAQDCSSVGQKQFSK